MRFPVGRASWTTGFARVRRYRISTYGAEDNSAWSESIAVSAFNVFHPFSFYRYQDTRRHQGRGVLRRSEKRQLTGMGRHAQRLRRFRIAFRSSVGPTGVGLF